MLNNLRNTVKHTAIYSIGNISTKFIGLILLPFYTKYLSVTDYGVLGLLEITSLIVIGIFGFRLSISMMRWYADASSSKERKTIVFTIYTTTFLIVVLFNLILQPFNENFSILFFNSNKYTTYFLLIFLSASVEILNKVYLDLLRLREKSITYIIVNSAKIATILILNIYFISVLKMGIEGILLGQLIGNVVMLVFSIPTLWSNFFLKLDFKLFKAMFNYGFPLIFSGLSGLLLSFADRYLITYFLGYSSNGIYTLAFKIAGVLNLLVLNSFQMGFLPIAFKMYGQLGDKRFYSKILTYLVFILVIFGLGLTIFSKEVIEVFTLNNDYLLAYKYVPYLCLMFCFKGIQYVFLISFHNTKKTQYTPLIIGAGLVLNILLNILFIPTLKITGAALSTVLSGLLTAVLYYYYAQKFFTIHYELKKVFLMLFIGIALFLASQTLDGIVIWVRIWIKLALICMFPILLIPFKFYERVEIESLQGFWKKWKSPMKWKANIGQIKIK